MITVGEVAAWLLANDTVAIVTWVGSVVAVVGLPATFKQARAARKAATAARQAVEELEGRLSLASLSYAYAQLDSIRMLVARREMAVAQMLLGPVKRTIIEACQLLTTTPGRSAKVDIARKSLKAVEHQIGLSIGSPERY